MEGVNTAYGKRFNTYEELWQWSVESLSDFWREIWEFAGIRSSQPYRTVIDDATRVPAAGWFSGAELNFAENLLRYRDDRVALVFTNESGASKPMTYAELYREVARLAGALIRLGIAPGDRVAGFMPNIPQTVAAMLASASLGAVWSSCSPDFGIKGVLDRFSQIRPKVLFTADGYTFKGTPYDTLDRVSDIIKELPSVEKVVVVPYLASDPDIDRISRGVQYKDFIQGASDPEIEFVQLPFEHPLYIMYSSGTTGLPKCMVQSAGGVLINHLKELLLHTDLKRSDTIFYFTTCGWMMWNWLVSSLAIGARVVLYDGNPFFPHPGALWEMAEREGVTIFGTSAGYLGGLQNTGLIPRDTYDLRSVRAVLSTGSPLSEEGFEFVHEAVTSDARLSSISGGSDINGCFVAGNPMGPVYSGEIQCRALGMDVHAFSEEGRPVVDEEGELVCTSPSPSMPIYFWDDTRAEKYKSAYFDTYPGVWRHGDYIKINRRGGVVIYGRSDATLNPGGVRIGTAEIYRLVEQVAEVEDSLVIGQAWEEDTRIVLFVKLSENAVLDTGLKERIKTGIRTNVSPRHVPARILAVADIPYTLNMKKVELAVKKIVEGHPVLNRDALINPEALECYRDLPELQEP